MSAGARDRTRSPGYRLAVRILLFAAVAVPGFWFIEMLLNAGLNGYACYPGLTPQPAASEGMGWVVWMRFLVEALAAIGAIAGLALSYRIWAGAQRDALADPRVAHGMGRTSFAAMWGMLFSGGFLLAILFDFIATLVMPLCA